MYIPINVWLFSLEVCLEHSIATLYGAEYFIFFLQMEQKWPFDVNEMLIMLEVNEKKWTTFLVYGLTLIIVYSLLEIWYSFLLVPRPTF